MPLIRTHIQTYTCIHLLTPSSEITLTSGSSCFPPCSHQYSSCVFSPPQVQNHPSLWPNLTSSVSRWIFFFLPNLLHMKFIILDPSHLSEFITSVHPDLGPHLIFWTHWPFNVVLIFSFFFNFIPRLSSLVLSGIHFSRPSLRVTCEVFPSHLPVPQAKLDVPVYGFLTPL